MPLTRQTRLNVGSFAKWGRIWLTPPHRQAVSDSRWLTLFGTLRISPVKEALTEREVLVKTSASLSHPSFFKCP